MLSIIVPVIFIGFQVSLAFFSKIAIGFQIISPILSEVLYGVLTGIVIFSLTQGYKTKLKNYQRFLTGNIVKPTKKMQCVRFAEIGGF